MADITLVQQAQSESNNATSCSLTINNCTVGNTLILGYVTRGSSSNPINNPIITDGWEKIGGGNNSDLPATGCYQRLFFAKKVVESKTETVTLTQTLTGRLYLVCGEFSGDFDVVMRNDMANIGASNLTVNVTKSNASDIILYGVTTPWGDSGRPQTTSPSDLTKLQGSSEYERLACWFDDGSGALSHTFKANNLSGSYEAYVECVQLVPKPYKYLVRNNDTIYTVSDGALTEVTGTLNAQLFKDYGVEEIPSGTLLMTLSNPEVLCWVDALKLPLLNATVQGTPQPQVIVSQEIDLMDASIKGIESVAIDCKGEVLFAISFDKKATWVIYNGTEWVEVSNELAGMTKAVFEAITIEQWQAQYEISSEMYIRCTLIDEAQSITTVNIDFIN